MQWTTASVCERFDLRITCDVLYSYSHGRLEACMIGHAGTVTVHVIVLSNSSLSDSWPGPSSARQLHAGPHHNPVPV